MERKGGREEGERERERERISKNKVDQRQVTPKKSLKSFPTCPRGLFMSQNSSNHTLIVWTVKIYYEEKKSIDIY